MRKTRGSWGKRRRGHPASLDYVRLIFKTSLYLSKSLAQITHLWESDGMLTEESTLFYVRVSLQENHVGQINKYFYSSKMHFIR